MIHIFIGTKAQYIKTAPVIKELEKRSIDYNLIDSGQHAELQEKFRNFLEIRKPDVILRKGAKDITSPRVLIQWFFTEFLKSGIFPKDAKKSFFRNKDGICLIHGDTPTTLLSALIAKRCNLKVGHLEAGLRSYSLFDPFPEELIRIFVMKLSDHLFISSDWAGGNLRDMHIKGKVIRISANTGLDALRFSMSKYKAKDAGAKNYCLFSIHRFERLISKKKVIEIIEMAEEISKSKKVLFPLHPPTKTFLKKYGLLDRLLAINNLISSELYEHGRFLHILKNADFVVTDGGSIQEESYYLGVPCLIMRRHTERQEGLGKNAILGAGNRVARENFLNNYQTLRGDDLTQSNLRPSAEIVDYLEALRL